MSRAELVAVLLMLAGGGVLVGRACQQAESDTERVVYLAATVLTVIWTVRRCRGPAGGSVITAPAPASNVIPFGPASHAAGLAA